MPDTLNKQTLINLLIDSPLREPIKINLIDIVNNTSEPDLPKIYPTIVKELEIFQKATERRMKLADETIAKLGGTSPTSDAVAPATAPNPPASPSPSMSALPPLDLPPLPAAQTQNEPTPPSSEAQTQSVAASQVGQPQLSVPPLDLPPLPASPAQDTATPAPEAAVLPTPEPLGGTSSQTPNSSSDEDALAEIQKELESLKAGVAADANPTPAPAPATPQA